MTLFGKKGIIIHDISSQNREKQKNSWFSHYIVWSKLVSWELEVTPSATPFFKRTYKISRPPRLWVSWIDLPSFASSSKIWPNFSNKVFFSWSYEKVILTKNEKKIRKDSDDFWHRKFTLKVQFSHFAPSWES